ncbi:MAG: hypothetical protein ACYDCL_16075 [Myxococcales bacterium]
MGILALSLWLGANPAPPRIVVPEGWIQVEPGQAGGGGTLTVVPAPPPEPAAAREPPVPLPAAAPPPPVAARRAPQPCRRLLERVLGRIAWLHELLPDFEGVPISPATRTALYPYGSAFANPNEPPIELTWDSELRDLFLAYNRCLLKVERSP